MLNLPYSHTSEQVALCPSLNNEVKYEMILHSTICAPNTHSPLLIAHWSPYLHYSTSIPGLGIKEIPGFFGGKAGEIVVFRITLEGGISGLTTFTYTKSRDGGR